MSSRTERERHVLALSYAPYGTCDAERAVAAELGWTFREASYESPDWANSPADVLLNVGGWPIDDEILQRTGASFVVGYGVGTDYIDVDMASRRGVSVANMPRVNAFDVATHTLAMILACVRGLGQSDRDLRSGGFDCGPSTTFRRTTGLTLGFLAFGNIPQELARLAAPLGFSMVAFDPYASETSMGEAGVRRVDDLDEFLAQCDILSVHVPSTPSTRGMLDQRRLSRLPRGASLVITSRGDVFDTKAVSELLDSRHLASAAFDVFETEPPESNVLVQSPHTILSPHVAGNSRESIAGMHDLAAHFLRRIEAGDAAEPGRVIGLNG